MADSNDDGNDHLVQEQGVIQEDVNPNCSILMVDIDGVEEVLIYENNIQLNENKVYQNDEDLN